ncbi:GIY-YIG nuclease family protein [Pedobacter flavus]|uniref:GIY-YIG nuclease family protein n=1 Tax=Pedobacter flavus TaxID=3113906 RepID=UPI003D67BF9E
MLFYIYILHSNKSDKFYIGYTSNIHLRVFQHNFGAKLSYTHKHRPWKLKALFCCGNSKSDAITIENFIKKQKSKTFIKKIIDHEILTTVFPKLVRVKFC